MGKKTVVIVDDDKVFLEELETLLAYSGYDLVAVSDSLSALDIVPRIKPDVILMDLKMPGKNGFQLANEMQGILETENTPVIAMSAYFKDEYMPLLNICGIKRYLKKPFDPGDVIAQIEGALRGNG